MPTIQIREVPEEAYEVLRRRARRGGQSLQAYMRDQVVSLATRPSKEDALASVRDIHAEMRRRGQADVSLDTILADLAADRR